MAQYHQQGTRLHEANDKIQTLVAECDLLQQSIADIQEQLQESDASCITLAMELGKTTEECAQYERRCKSEAERYTKLNAQYNTNLAENESFHTRYRDILS